MLPSLLIPACFWDCDPTSIDLRAHRRFITERVMEYGDDEAVTWLLRTYSREELSDVVCKTRALTAKTITCWANYLGLNEEGGACISRSCRPEDRPSFQA